MKIDLFQSYSHSWVFQICWHIECSIFTALFRIWNSSSGIPSTPIALLLVMLLARSQHTRSHPWQGHEEKTWQTRQIRTSGIRKAALVLTWKMISVFLMLAVLDYSLISVTRAEGLPRSLSKQNQLRTLINMSPKTVVSYKIIQDERSVSI